MNWSGAGKKKEEDSIYAWIGSIVALITLKSSSSDTLAIFGDVYSKMQYYLPELPSAINLSKLIVHREPKFSASNFCNDIPPNSSI